MQKKQFDHPPRRVALFVTCMVDMMYPNVGMAAVELLERFDIEVLFPEEQTCCGQPAFNAGFQDEARQLAQRFINIFEPLLHSGTVDAIVAPSGSCVTMTSHFYPALFESNLSDPFYRRATTLAQSTFELTEFLVDVLNVSDVNAHLPGDANVQGESQPPVTLTYHACCHLLRELRVDTQPRMLLSNVQGATVVELEGSDECCGFGGLFSVKNPGISTAIGDRKVKNLNQSGADVVAMCDVSCMTHINGLLEKQGHRCRALHIAEVLNHHLDDEQRDSEQPLIEKKSGSDVAKNRPSAGSGTDGAKKIASSIKPNSLQSTSPQIKPNKPSKPKPLSEPPRPRRWQDY